MSDEDVACCEGRMVHGLFELNFTIPLVTKKMIPKAEGGGTKEETIMQSGLVQVFACPANPKYSIVTFVNTSNGDQQVSLDMFREVYKLILDKGANELLIDTRETRKELEAIAKKAFPNFDDLDDFLED